MGSASGSKARRLISLDAVAFTADTYSMPIPPPLKIVGRRVLSMRTISLDAGSKRGGCGGRHDVLMKRFENISMQKALAGQLL